MAYDGAMMMMMLFFLGFLVRGRCWNLQVLIAKWCHVRPCDGPGVLLRPARHRKGTLTGIRLSMYIYGNYLGLEGDYYIMTLGPMYILSWYLDPFGMSRGCS